MKQIVRNVPNIVIASLAAMLFFVVGLWLRQVFSGQIILNPTLIAVGPISIKWYGLSMASAIGIGYVWSYRRLVARGIAAEVADKFLWWAILAGIVGARLGFVVQNLNFYQLHPLEMLAVNHGGLSIHGAVLVGALAAAFIAWREKLSLAVLADAVAPALLLGAVIGRMGNFVNYELYGYPTDVAWKMFVPIAYRLPGYESFSYFHPTFLYEALLNLLMLGGVLWLDKRWKYDAGELFWLTVGLYSVSRFIVEYFRIGATFVNGATMAQIVSLVILLASIIVITRKEIERAVAVH